MINHCLIIYPWSLSMTHLTNFTPFEISVHDLLKFVFTVKDGQLEEAVLRVVMPARLLHQTNTVA